MRTQGPSGLGLRITGLTRLALGLLFGLYILQLLGGLWLGLPIDSWVQLHRFASPSWGPWQALSSVMFNSTASPLAAALDWVGLLFFLGPVQDLLGTRRLLRGLAASLVGAALFTLGADLVGALASPAPTVGLGPVLLALLLMFGLARPDASIKLYFLIPIKAAWVAWGAGVLSLLFFLSSRDLGGAMALGAWVSALIWLKAGTGSLRRLTLRWRARQLERELEQLRPDPKPPGGDYIH